ncbi:MAG: CDP-alcohol phosphatidyltransferase family protein [Micropruina sp.]|uniref:CDP-alcohol phosphatidyltransferase family protein n=1 Tax=Micropruina sp. TaxID=2737536 RepID=UPI0039E545CD
MTTSQHSAVRINYAQLQAAQKSSKGAPIYSLLVNRPLGRLFAAVAHRLGMTPDQVTAVSALFTFTGILLIALVPPSPALAVGVTVALVLGYALDAADGQLARLRGGGSLTGEWLDHVIDSFKIATLHLAVLISMYRFFDVTPIWLLVPVVFAAVYVIHFFGMLLTDLLTRNARLRKGDDTPAPSAASPLMSLLKLPTDYGLLALSFLLLAVPVAFQWFYLFLTVANAGYTFLVLGAWYRRLRALDAELAG